jgi:hypothetical protein
MDNPIHARGIFSHLPPGVLNLNAIYKSHVVWVAQRQVSRGCNFYMMNIYILHDVRAKKKTALKLEHIVFKEVPIIIQSTHQNSPVSQIETESSFR